MYYIFKNDLLEFLENSLTVLEDSDGCFYVKKKKKPYRQNNQLKKSMMK